jgi:hypothetical protein
METPTYIKSKSGWGTTEYRTTLPDGRQVTIAATGQRNGRNLGGAWAATYWPTGDEPNPNPSGRGPVTIATGGTLAACKEALSQIAAG